MALVSFGSKHFHRLTTSAFWHVELRKISGNGRCGMFLGGYRRITRMQFFEARMRRFERNAATPALKGREQPAKVDMEKAGRSPPRPGGRVCAGRRTRLFLQYT